MRNIELCNQTLKGVTTGQDSVGVLVLMEVTNDSVSFAICLESDNFLKQTWGSIFSDSTFDKK